MRSSAIFSVSLLIFAACASQRAPSGGPEDKIPPEIIATDPESGAVRVPLNTQVELRYSEKIDRDTFFDAAFVSPDPGEVSVKHKRKKTIIKFLEPLLENRTYVLTLGTNLRDAHNVSLDQSFTFAFSTGDSIDKGQIDGQIFDAKAQGISIWAYILNDSIPPPDPAQKNGDYSTQVGADGKFSIPFMAEGDYRLFAVEDAGKTGNYNVMEDRIGVANRDVQIKPGQQHAGHMTFIMMREDTLAPVLTNAGMRDASTIEVKFSEAITAADSQWKNLFSVSDTLQQTFFPIQHVARFPLDAKRFDIVIDPVDVEKLMRFSALGVQDTSGNKIDTAYAFYDFESHVRQDTIAPRIISYEPPDQSAHIVQNTGIKIYFNEWMQETRTDSTFYLQDTLGGKISGTGHWDNPFTYNFDPDTLLLPKTMYRFHFRTANFLDRAGNALFDTSDARVFTTINPDTLSSIAGTVIDQRNNADSSTTYHLTAKQVGKPEIAYNTTARNNQNYIFESMLPGRYIIQGFIDENKDGRRSLGSLQPYSPAEYTFLYPDTIAIRSKWPNEGEDILITD